MNQSEKRRKQLLEETRNQYSYKKNNPAVHPRYRNVYSEMDDDTYSAGTLGIRITICLLLFAMFLTMDHTNNTMFNVSSNQVENAISEEVALSDIMNYMSDIY